MKETNTQKKIESSSSVVQTIASDSRTTWPLGAKPKKISNSGTLSLDFHRPLDSGL